MSYQNHQRSRIIELLANYVCLIIVMILRMRMRMKNLQCTHLFVTVPLKGKLTLETRTLEPRCSKRSRIEYRVSSIEFRGSRNKAFSDMQKLERVSRKRFISRRELYCSSVSRRSLSRENIRPCVDCGLNVTFL